MNFRVLTAVLGMVLSLQPAIAFCADVDNGAHVNGGNGGGNEGAGLTAVAS